MTTMTSCKLAALAILALALSCPIYPAGAMVAAPGPALSAGDVILVAQKRTKQGAKRSGGNKQQQQMQGAKKYLPAEYQQYLGGGAGGAGGGGMGGGGMGGGGMGGGGMGGGMGR